MSLQPSTRRLRDELLKLTRTIAAAGAANASASLDLGAAGPAALEQVELEIAVPALPALVETDKFLTVTVEDSADNSSFAVIAQLEPVVIAGVVTTGAAALTRKFRLPSSTRRYVRITTGITAAGGDSTGVTVAATLLC